MAGISSIHYKWEKPKTLEKHDNVIKHSTLPFVYYP
jgi:hypothetical protein